MAIMNNVSVWWHVVGAAAIVLILIFVPDQHQSFSYVFTERFNNSGFGDGSTGGFAFWFCVVPFGFLLTQYTITGFDASRPPLGGDRAARRGGRQGHLALDLLLGASAATSCCSAFVFAVPNDADGDRTTRCGVGGVALIFDAARWARTGRRSVLFISASASSSARRRCMTSASRMTFAFSRDGAIPGSATLVEAEPPSGSRPTPSCSSRVVGRARHAAGADRGQRRTAAPVIPVAFYAVVVDRGDRALPGLRHPDLAALAAWATRFEAGSWNNGREVQVDEPDRGRRDRRSSRST